jgi:hypothetical protein
MSKNARQCRVLRGWLGTTKPACLHLIYAEMPHIMKEVNRTYIMLKSDFQKKCIVINDLRGFVFLQLNMFFRDNIDVNFEF